MKTGWLLLTNQSVTKPTLSLKYKNNPILEMFRIQLTILELI